MPTSKPPYPAEFRDQMVELAQAGRSLKQPSREFGVSANAIRNWIQRADGRRPAAAPRVGEVIPLSAAERQELVELRRRLKQVQMERDILAKATAWVSPARASGRPRRLRTREDDIQADFPVRTLCRVLRVSASGYYDWLERALSARALANAGLVQRINRIHQASDATYGAPRIQAELAEEGIVAGHNRIARLMRLHGLRGVSRRRNWCVTTRRDSQRQPTPDLVQRRFQAADINQLWVADMTYIPTWAGFGYLAVVLDVFSRKVVGWSFGQRQTADLVLAALNMALPTRKPHGVIHHSDQGSQYTSVEFGRRCAQMGVRPSMGSVGDAYDNAMAESFFASLECELIDRRAWKSFAQARMEIFTWIEGWYNPRRRHSGLGQKSPVNYEREHAHKVLRNDGAGEDGLPNGCFAPVDKPPLGSPNGPSACPQASPLDNPAAERAHINHTQPE